MKHQFRNGFDLFEELLSSVKSKGLNYLSLSTKVVSDDKGFSLKLNVPGYSKAKGKFKSDHLVLDIVGRDEAIVFQLPDNFYEMYDIKTVKYSFEHGVLSIHVDAFPVSNVEPELVHEFHLGFEKQVFEVDFRELKSFTASVTNEEHKAELDKIVADHANGHTVKNLSKDTLSDLSNAISKLKEVAISEEVEDVETVKACDMMLHYLEHDLEEKYIEEEATIDLVEE